MPHAGETKIAERSLARSRIKEKICWLDVSMYNLSGMNVAQGSEHAAKVGFNSSHWQGAVKFLLEV
jgi:hypothetical protein